MITYEKAVTGRQIDDAVKIRAEMLSMMHGRLVVDGEFTRLSENFSKAAIRPRSSRMTESGR